MHTIFFWNLVTDSSDDISKKAEKSLENEATMVDNQSFFRFELWMEELENKFKVEEKIRNLSSPRKIPVLNMVCVTIKKKILKI